MERSWERSKKIADRKTKFIESVPEQFIDVDVKKSEAELIEALNDLIDQMETEDGHIKKTKKNFMMIDKVDQVFRSFAFGAGFVMMGSLISKFNKVVSNVFSYFGTILDPSTKKFNSTKKDILDLVNRRLGIKDGEAVNGGFISDLIEMSEVKNNVKENLFRDILSEPTPTELKKSIKTFLSGEKDKRGAIRKFYSRFTGDSFSTIDRMATLEFATANELTQFVYYGTVIKTTRPFCRKKINGIYSISEGLKWPYETPKPLGISTATYNPVVDMGGENCRHLAYFITDDMADEMRSKGFNGFNG